MYGLCLIGVLRLTGVSYTAYLQGADWISYLLTPATVCLALPLYDKLALLKAHWRAVCAGMLCGVLTSLLCVLGLCKLLKLSPQLYATFLPKSITTAIGMGVAEELGPTEAAMSSLSLAVCGLLTALLAPLFYSLF